jgi:hypothetical protein
MAAADLALERLASCESCSSTATRQMIWKDVSAAWCGWQCTLPPYLEVAGGQPRQLEQQCNKIHDSPVCDCRMVWLPSPWGGWCSKTNSLESSGCTVVCGLTLGWLSLSPVRHMPTRPSTCSPISFSQPSAICARQISAAWRLRQSASASHTGSSWPAGMRQQQQQIRHP